MKLKDYIRLTNLSHKQAALEIGISVSALSNYIHERREPRPHIRIKIIAWSNKKIKVGDLLKNG